MANYKVPASGGDRRRAPPQRHRQGDEGRPAPTGRRPPGRGGRVSADGTPRPLGPGRPAGRRAGRVGGGTLGGGAAGRLGRRRDQGRVAGRRPDAQRVRVARHRRATCPNPAFALDNRGKRSVVARPAPGRGPAAPRGAAGHGRRLHQQPPARRPRRPRSRAGGHRGPPSPPRVLQHQRLRPPGRRAEPPHLRHRGLLGPVRPVGADGRRRGHPAQRPRRHRRPHHRPGRAGRPPGRRARAARDRARPGRRGLAAADRHLRARMGPGPADDARQGRSGRAPGPQPGAADEPVPGRRRPLVLLHRPGGGSPHRRRVPCPRPPRPARRPPLRRRLRHPPEPHRGHRHPRRDRRRATRWTTGRSGSTEEGVWWAPAQTPAEVVEDAAAARQRRVRRDRRRWRGRHPASVNGPVSFSDVPDRPARAGARGSGEHTDEVLGELADRRGSVRPAAPSAGPGPAGPGR